MDGIENAVFKTLWHCTFDTESYWEAVSKDAPDDITINTLKESIKSDKKKLKGVEEELDDLVERVLKKKILKPETIQKKEAGLILQKEHWAAELEADQKKLDSMPRLKDYEHDVKAIRKALLKKYRSLKHLEAMTYKDKRRLLHSLFDGRDADGKRYGIYVRMESKKNKRRKHFRFYIYARLFTEFGGFLTDVPDDFDIHEWARKRRAEWSKRAGKHKQSDQGRKKLGKMRPRKRRKEYKTKSILSK